MQPQTNTLVPNTSFHLGLSGLTLTDSVAATLTKIVTWKIPDGELIAIPRILPITMKLYKAGPTEIDRYAKIGLGILTSADADRVRGIGAQLWPYRYWYGVDLGVQGNADYRDTITQRICSEACPMIVVDQDETLVIQALVTSDVIDTSISFIEFPIFHGAHGQADAELALRRLEIGA